MSNSNDNNKTAAVAETGSGSLLLANGVQLSDNAQTLHSTMMKQGVGKLFNQQELQTATNISSLADLMLIVQELLDQNLIKLIKQNNELKFQGVDILSLIHI